MSSHLTDLFHLVLEASWQGSLIILLILALRPFMGSRIPALWRYLLWMFVLIRLLIPVSFLPPSPVSMQNIAVVDRPVEQVQTLFPPAHEEIRPVFDQPAANVPSPAPVVVTAYPIPWWTVAATVWFLGALLMLGIMVSAQILLWRRLARNGSSVDPAISAIWTECRARLNIKTGPFLCMSPDISSPALAGWFFPILLLPEKNISSLSKEDWDNIFVHELAHYQRADHWIHTLQLAALAVHWFNPVVWLGFRQLRTDRELAADEWALQRLAPEQAATYGDTLLKVLTESSRPAFSATGVGIVEDCSQLQLRLRRIVMFGQNSVVATLGGAILVLLLATLTLGHHWRPPTDYKWLDAGQIMMRAIQTGDIWTVKKQLNAGVNVNYEGGVDNDFPLYTAVIYDQPEIVKLLITRGADVNKKNGWGDVASFRAFWLGRKECADLLLQAGAPQDELAYYAGTGDVAGLERLNAKKAFTDADIRRGLNFAVASGNVATFDWLLPRLAPMNPEQKQSLFLWLYDMGSRGGNVDMIRHLESLDSSSPKFAHTSLFFGVMWNRIDLVKYLLSKPGVHWDPDPDEETATLLFDVQSPEMAEYLISRGVDVNTRNKKGETALIQICRNAWNSPQTALVLLKHGADPNARDNDGWTPLLYARDGATVDELLHYGADIHAINNNGDGVLDSISSGDVSRLQALIRHGVPFDRKEGSSVLTRASWRNQLELMNYLIGSGIDPNIEGTLFTHDGKPSAVMIPLDAAVISGSFEAARLLVDRGVQPDNQLMLKAIYGKRTEIVKLFWDHNIRPVSPLCYAISQGASIEELQKILNQGSPVNPAEDTAIAPLSEACHLDNLPAVQLLVEHGADMNAGGSPDAKFPVFRMSPFRVAIEEGRDEIVAYLLQHGAKNDYAAVLDAVGYSTPYNDAPLKTRMENVVKMLIDAGALKQISETETAGVLQRAIITRQGSGNLTVLKMLLEQGLSLESKNEQGKTVLEWAREINLRTQGTAPGPEIMTFLNGSGQ